MAYGDSTAASLAAVRTAIGACLTSQQYTLRGRQQQMAQLASLRALEKELIDESNCGGRMCELALPVRAQ